MNELSSFKNIPIGSILALPETETPEILAMVKRLPQFLRQIVLSPKTGAFVRGLARTYNITPENQVIIAQAILFVAVQKISLSALQEFIVKNISLENSQAQNIATEIERELFTPLALEFGQFVKKNQGDNTAPLNNLPNVLDLKNQPPKLPSPPPIPPR